MVSTHVVNGAAGSARNDWKTFTGHGAPLNTAPWPSPGNWTNVACDKPSAACWLSAGGVTGSYSFASTSVGTSLCTGSLNDSSTDGTSQRSQRSGNRVKN